MNGILTFDKDKFAADIARVKRDFSVAQGKQINFAIVQTLTVVAAATRDALYTEMSRVFVEPTPYTLNSLYILRAQTESLTKGRKERLWAEIGIKDKADKGIAPIKYLAAEVEGGLRNTKRSERALQYKGLLRQGGFLVPGEGAKLDTYGNIPGALMVQILSALQAAEMGLGFTANRSIVSRLRNKKLRNFFVPLPSSRLTSGVWERRGSGKRARIVKVIAFTETMPQYDKRLDFHGIAYRTAKAKFYDIFRRNITQAFATAR